MGCVPRQGCVVISVEAYAKINLTLEVLGKRLDGYHEVRSVVQAISLCDRLVFENCAHLSFQCSSPDWVAEKSLVSRAAELLMLYMGERRGAKIKLDKHIPLSSGLGGDSSDAAAVLCGLNRLWEACVSVDDMMGLAAKLGSDVPFFLKGGTALAQGRGDVVSSLPQMPCTWLVLLFPDVATPSAKTEAMYSSLCQEHFTRGAFTDELVVQLTHGAAITHKNLFNVFDEIALHTFPGLNHCSVEFQRVAGVRVHLAGAGPTLFALFSDEEQAKQVCHRLHESGMNACLAVTCGYTQNAFSA